MADGKVEIELELDDGNIKGEAEKAGKDAGSSFATSLKRGIKTIAGAYIFKELAQGAYELGKAAISAYASYEQLVGGVEKIFDEADQSQIIKDAQNAYMDLNMSANQYLEIINQTGAAFASTMGDQAGYDAARTGLKAISDYASGTGRSIDELSDKFTLITRSTSSYQSIADQFSGVLPATSAAFLEQAQAAGFLSDEYKKLTEVPIDEYQMAVTKMLEQGVEQLGLAGNTLKETEKTITGSLAATSAAWENWLAGLADDEADLEALTQNLIDRVANTASLIVPHIGTVVKSLFDLLMTELPVILDSIIETISNDAVNISKAALDYFLMFVVAIAKATPEILKALLLLMAATVVALYEKGEEFLEQGVELIKSLASGFAAGFAYVLSEIGRGITDGINRIKSFWADFFNAGSYITDGLADGIANAAGRAADAAANVALSALNAARSTLDEHSPSRKAFEIGEFFTEGIELGVASRKRSLNQIVGDVASDMLAAATPQLAYAGGYSSSTTSYSFGDVVLNASDAYGITAIEQLLDLIESA